MGPGKLPGHSAPSVQEYEKAARCIAVLKNACADFLDIDALFDSHPECSTVFVGKVADGGECTDDNDCSSATSIRQDEARRPARPRRGQLLSTPGSRASLTE
ncbi:MULTISPECIES: hypothetical protein [Sorangium]|uniref:hypothetical protein n=1 Tax=Sorangium TaxID=39643 RepID=UPI003D9C2E00